MQNIYDNEAFFSAYAEMGRSKYGLTGAGEWHQLASMFPDLTGKVVLDLGCGYGWHCKYAAEHGAKSVLGIDLSKRMLSTAMQKNADSVVTYRYCSITEYEYPEDTYDLVVCNLALHYIADLDAVYRQVYRTLKPDGVFLFNIEHPTFTAGVNQDWVYDDAGKPLYWPVDNYYFSGERETLFLGQKVQKQHHTLTQIVNGLLRAGFTLQALEEAMPPQEMMNIPGMADELRRPMMLLVRAGKE